MELFCFASNNLTNIWAGVGSRLWAVAETSDVDMKRPVTKSKRLIIGSLGLLYCNKTHAFTTPFLVYAPPDPDRIVTDIWPERWRLPFSIHPLGTPRRQVHMDEAWKRWPVLKKSAQNSVSAAMNLTGTTVFVPVDISAEDWAAILQDLAAAG
jgi:hypothetical protein